MRRLRNGRSCSWSSARRGRRTDPFERADITSNTYYNWFLHHDYIALAAQAILTSCGATFKESHPRQKPASFTIDQALDKMSSVASGAGH